MAINMAKNNSNYIPASNLSSWMHQRITLKRESKTTRLERYNSQKEFAKKMDYFIAKVIKFFHFYNPTFRWALYHVYMKLKQFWYRIYNRMEIVGEENIPKKGAIFIINHFGSKDVILFLSSLVEPVGVFTAVGKGLAADILEKYLNFVPRLGSGKEMIEKMVRCIWEKTRYFAMWPEGTISKDATVLESFSGIIKVYATLNSKKNIIPIVPVIMQNTDTYRFHKHRQKPKKIRITYLKPYYFPRHWLESLENGGKSPRFLIDHIMLKIANMLGQKELHPNRILHWRRKKVKEHKKW